MVENEIDIYKTNNNGQVAKYYFLLDYRGCTSIFYKV